MSEQEHFKGQIDALREHVDSRFTGMERWTERISIAVEKMSETMGKYATLEQMVDIRIRGTEDKIKVVETRLNETQIANRARFDAIESTLANFTDKLGERIRGLELKIAYWSGGIFVVGLLAQILIKKLGM